MQGLSDLRRNSSLVWQLGGFHAATPRNFSYLGDLGVSALCLVPLYRVTHNFKTLSPRASDRKPGTVGLLTILSPRLTPELSAFVSHGAIVMLRAVVCQRTSGGVAVDQTGSAWDHNCRITCPSQKGFPVTVAGAVSGSRGGQRGGDGVHGVRPALPTAADHGPQAQPAGRACAHCRGRGRHRRAPQPRRVRAQAPQRPRHPPLHVPVRTASDWSLQLG